MKPRYGMIICLLAILFAGMVAYGCLGPGSPAVEGPKKFSSPQELDRYVRDQVTRNSIETDIIPGTGQAAGLPVMKQSAVNVPVPSAAPASVRSESHDTNAGYSAGDSAVTPDYSQTNVQVAGVDESDFVKNDGRYMYLINNGQLVIVDAYPGENARIVSRTELDGTPASMFLNGDRVVVFSSDYTSDGNNIQGLRAPYSYGPETRIIIYSVANESSPELVEEYAVDGSYFDSRMIGDYVYFITKDPVVLTDDPIPLPGIKNTGSVVTTPDVYYFDRPERQFVFHTIASVNIQAPTHIEAQTYLLGYSDILYVSPTNMYISYPKPVEVQPQPVWKFDVTGIIPAAAPANAPVPDLSQPDIMDRFNRMTEDEKQAFIQSIQGKDTLQAYETDRTSTVIQKFSIDEGRINYIAEGTVKGNLLNQFSMDEYNGNLRIATTSDVNTPRNYYQYNNVIVLDPGMKQIGSLTHLAMNEKIYSARFIGNRLYLVTFKRMDPFFVIDLSDPGAMRVLGKLKIPGYSDYLHPYDDTHIIGIGKETGTNSWGGVSTQGVKVALFDVSDVDHPKQLSSYEIGGPGSDSPALDDHRAFLFSKDKNILVLPVSVVQSYQPVPQTGQVMPPYRQNTWQGVYIFGFTPQYGIVLKGTISHSEDIRGVPVYGSPSEVKRSLYIGDELSTISDRLIKINSLRDLNDTISEIDLDNLAYPGITR